MGKGMQPTTGGVTKEIYLDVADMSADDTYYMLVPAAGKIEEFRAIVDGAIGTADITVTPSLNGVAISGGVVTLPTSGSAAGTTASASVPVPPNCVKGDKISLAIAGGGSGGSPRGHIVAVIRLD